MAGAIVFILLLAFMALIGVRLVLKRSEGESGPVAWIGYFFLCLCGMLIFRYCGANPDFFGPFSRPFVHLGNVCFVASDIILLSFTWQVFRAEAEWARNLVMTCSALLVSILFARAVMGEVTWLLILLSGIRSVTWGWAFAESVHYYGAMRRRNALGIADPLITNRFLLWSVWTGSMALLPLGLLAMRVVALASGAGVDPLQGASGSTQIQGDDPTLLLVLFVIASTIAMALAALWLCFFPPNAYVSWIRGGTEEEAAV